MARTRERRTPALGHKRTLRHQIPRCPLGALSGSRLSDKSFYERDRDRVARLRPTQKSPSAGATELKVLGHDQFKSNQSHKDNTSSCSLLLQAYNWLAEKTSLWFKRLRPLTSLGLPSRNRSAGVRSITGPKVQRPKYRAQARSAPGSWGLLMSEKGHLPT